MLKLQIDEYNKLCYFRRNNCPTSTKNELHNVLTTFGELLALPNLRENQLGLILHSFIMKLEISLVYILLVVR